MSCRTCCCCSDCCFCGFVGSSCSVAHWCIPGHCIACCCIACFFTTCFQSTRCSWRNLCHCYFQRRWRLVLAQKSRHVQACKSPLLETATEQFSTRNAARHYFISSHARPHLVVAAAESRRVHRCSLQTASLLPLECSASRSLDVGFSFCMTYANLYKWVYALSIVQLLLLTITLQSF